MNWTLMLQSANIEEPPGYKETVERCLKRKAAGLVMKKEAQKKGKTVKR